MLNCIIAPRLLRYKYLPGINREENDREARLLVGTSGNSLMPVLLQHEVGKRDSEERLTATETVLGVSSYGLSGESCVGPSSLW